MFYAVVNEGVAKGVPVIGFWAGRRVSLAEYANNEVCGGALTDHQAQLVEPLVVSSCYQNASEVLRTGLRMVEKSER